MTATLTERGTHREQREHVARLHSYLTRYQLVTWTSGNVSERVPGEDPPDYLVCASPSGSGDELRGRVLRDRANGPPRLVSVATVTRPSTRTVYLRFDPVAIKRPTHVRFAGEAVTRGAKCPKPLGCRDTAPDAPGTRNLTLHSASASG